MKHTSLAISDPHDLIFGKAPHPVSTRSGMSIGGGMVYPELNFTLPPIQIEEATLGSVYRNYEEIISGALRRKKFR